MAKSEEAIKRENIAAYFEGSTPLLIVAGILLLLAGGAMAYWGGGAWKHVGYESLAFGIIYFIFSGRSKVFTCIIAWVVLIVGAGLAFGTPNMLIGYATILFAIVLIVGNFFSMSSIGDDEMDKYINEDMQQIESNAVKLLDFEEESLLTKPVFLVSSPNFLDAACVGSDRKMKIGDDEIIRYSPINVAILYPCKKMVATYQAKWDLLTGKALNENTDEFFYKDITSVSMKAESVQLSKADIEKIKGDNEIIIKIHDELMKRAKKLPNEYEKLVVSGQQMMRMSTSGGNNVEVFLKNSEIDEIAGFKTRDTAEMEKGIQNLRKLIREKKSE